MCEYIYANSNQIYYQATKDSLELIDYQPTIKKEIYPLPDFGIF